MKKFFRTTYYLAVIALFLSVVVIGFTQTRAFRSYFRALIIEAASTGLEGELTLGQLKGNLFTGFHIDTVAIRESGEEIVFVERLEARYDPLSLLAKRLSLSRVTLVNPSCRITRSSAGSWNINRLIKPTPADTAPSAWVIDVKQLEVKNGAFFLVDSLVLASRASDSSFSLQKDQFNYANIELDSLNLNAGLTVRSRASTALVRSLSFKSARPHFSVTRLAGEFALAASEASIQNLELETSKSRLRLDARIRDIDLTKIDSAGTLKESPLSVHLRAQSIDFAELKQFIGSAIHFMDKAAACEVDAEGTLKTLNIKNVTVHTPSSILHTSGTISNLHHPRDLELDLTSVKNKIDPLDITEHLPGLGLPHFASWGSVEYDLWFKGTPTLFNARLIANSKAGTIDVDGQLDARASDLSYEGKITMTKLDLAPLLGDSVYTSKLNGVITFKGSGTKLDNVVTLVRAEVDSSQFYGLPVGRSVVVADLAERTLRSRVAARVSSTRLDAAGTLRFQPKDSVSYELEGRVNSLNLAELTRREEQASDLSFDLRARGTGLDLQAMRGDLNVNFFRSSFDTVRFDRGGFDVHLNTMDRKQQSFQFVSEAADLDVVGQFTPATLITSLGQGATLLSEAIRYRIASLDSLRAFSSGHAAPTEFRSSVAGPSEHVAARLSFDLKDASPIGVMLRRQLAGSLTLNGSITSAAEGIEFVGQADVSRLLYADGEADFGCYDAVLSYDIRGLSRTAVANSLAASVNFQARRFDLGSLEGSQLVVDMRVRADSGAYRLSALLDSLVTIEVQGTSRFDTGYITLNLPQLKVDFNSYTFDNIDPVRVVVGRDGFYIANLWMRHEVEEVSATGYFNPGGISDLTVGIRNFLLNNLPKVHRGLASEGSRAVFGGIVNAVGTFRGSFDHPNFSVELNATGVRYQETVFGQVLVRCSYFERVLNVFTQFRSRPDDLTIQPDLLITGTVPYNLSLKGLPNEKLEGEMNLDVRAKSFRLEFLDPFLTQLSNMSGLLICDVKLRGNVQSPSYEGSLTLQNARLLFDPLSIQYIVDGKLVPSGRQIGLEDLTIRNVPQDRPDGKMTLSGRFTLEGIEIKDFDLNPKGQLLVMKESGRRPGQIVYGDLFAASGPEGIQWRGTPSRSLVSGNLFVKYANLTLPPTRQAQDLPSNRIAVTLVNDLPAENQAGTRKSEQQNIWSPTIAGNTIPSDKTSARSASDHPSPLPQQEDDTSFLDNIVYDLVIQTQGVTQLRFIFTNLTNEELFAILRGRTAFTKDGDRVRLTGEVELGSGSYYNNIKKLDASGKLGFTGDLFNPELDVLARYEGIYQGKRDTASTPTRVSSGSTSSADTRGLEQKVVVKLYITGTREQPKVKTELERYDQLGNLIQETRGDAEADAIAFLITGSFRDELTQQDRLSLASTSVLGGLTSSVLSGPLTELLRKEFGIIRSVDVLYYGGSFQESADVRVTGELGDAVFRLGGRVLNDINNTNVSIQLPMSAILGSEKWRNLVLEAERRVEGVESFDQRRESKGLRLLYRITF